MSIKASLLKNVEKTCLKKEETKTIEVAKKIFEV